MNKTQALPSSAVQRTVPSTSLARRLVLPVLQRMKEGGMTLTLPDGSPLFLGSREAVVQAEMTINHDDFFQKVLRFGDIGFGESYVDGDWDTPSIERVIAWAIANIDHSPGMSGGKATAMALNLLRSTNRIKHLLHQFVDGSAGLLGFFNVLHGAGRLLKTRFIDKDQDGRSQHCQRQADGHSGD